MKKIPVSMKILIVVSSLLLLFQMSISVFRIISIGGSIVTYKELQEKFPDFSDIYNSRIHDAKIYILFEAFRIVAAILTSVVIPLLCYHFSKNASEVALLKQRKREERSEKRRQNKIAKLKEKLHNTEQKLNDMEQ